MARRQEEDRRKALLAAGVVAYATGVTLQEVLAASRGTACAATARHAAMYLTHVAFEMSLGRVAIAFGRDRSTVAHACHQIEERRDDAQVDDWLHALERALKRTPAALSPPPALSGVAGSAR
jgi:chromosomal replication initiation ATPase DnaA